MCCVSTLKVTFSLNVISMAHCQRTPNCTTHLSLLACLLMNTKSTSHGMQQSGPQTSNVITQHNAAQAMHRYPTINSSSSRSSSSTALQLVARGPAQQAAEKRAACDMDGEAWCVTETDSSNSSINPHYVAPSVPWLLCQQLHSAAAEPHQS